MPRRFRLAQVRPAQTKMAAGEPAANLTGRHHNVREDIDLVGRR